MAEPVKYMTIISDMLTLYQKELIKIFKKCIILTHFRSALGHSIIPAALRAQVPTNEGNLGQ